MTCLFIHSTPEIGICSLPTKHFNHWCNNSPMDEIKSITPKENRQLVNKILPNKLASCLLQLKHTVIIWKVWSLLSLWDVTTYNYAITIVDICFLPFTHGLAPIVIGVILSTTITPAPTPKTSTPSEPLKYLKICNKILEIKPLIYILEDLLTA